MINPIARDDNPDHPTKGITAVHALQHAVIEYIDDERIPSSSVQQLVPAAVNEYFSDPRITKSISPQEFASLADAGSEEQMLRMTHSVIDRLTDAITEQFLSKK